MSVRKWNDTAALYDILSLLTTTASPGNVTKAAAAVAAATTTEGDNNVVYLKDERLVEGLYLMMIALAGISLNLMIFGCVIVRKPLRKYTNGFIVHDCILNAFKSALCIPYSLAVLRLISPTYCNALGLVYVVSLTVSMFNLLAMVMAEAYTFHERNVNDSSNDGNGAAMCVIFGVVTIYIGSVILHLGPTLIGGEFKFNKDVGNCIFAYGKVQNYIVQVIWIIIVSLTLIVVFRYIYKFYRTLKANQRFRITNLARNAAAYTKGQDPDDDIYELVGRLKKRIRVLLCIASIYCASWYPLFILSVLDYSYTQPRYLYRVFTVVAWSHSALIPVVLLSMDHSFGIIHQIRQAIRTQRRHPKTSSPSTQPLTRDDCTMHGSQHTSLYNQTMNNAGRPVGVVDSPKSNHRREESTEEEISKLCDDPPLSPRRYNMTSSALLSDYDALSLEESPL